MMGCQTAPAQLFYDFCLDDHVPADDLLRGIDRHLELDIRAGSGNLHRGDKWNFCLTSA
jgi:hypothetical protein